MAAKRNYASYLLPYKSMNMSKPRTSVINMSSFSEPTGGPETASQEKEPEAEKMLDNYEFRRGFIPPYRQMFYQLCDIKVKKWTRRENSSY